MASDIFVYPPERDAKGHFLPGNTIGRAGGHARAKKLSPERRKAIARKGFDAMVASRFNGDRKAAVEWLAAKGQAANDAHYPPELRKFHDPGPMPDAG